MTSIMKNASANHYFEDIATKVELTGKIRHRHYKLFLIVTIVRFVQSTQLMLLRQHYGSEPSSVRDQATGNQGLVQRIQLFAPNLGLVGR